MSPVVTIDGLLTYTITCTHCGATVMQQHTVAHGLSLPLPLVPEGWRQMVHWVVCPAHTVRYEVDGEMQGEAR